jgi:hypothetical protein
LVGFVPTRAPRRRETVDIQRFLVAATARGEERRMSIMPRELVTG